MEVAQVNQYLQFVAHIVTILGLPLAILILIFEKRKERRDREYGTYNALDDKYVRYLEFCFENPDLDVYDIPIEHKLDSVSTKRRKELILFNILMSILERAYLTYEDQSTKIKRRQWEGWKLYIADFCSRPNFRREWHNLGSQFDEKFTEFMNSMISENDVQSEAKGLRR